MPVKQTVYTTHAMERMQERKISEDEVNTVLDGAGVTYPGKRGTTHYVDTVNGRRIRVTTKETDTLFKIVTVVAPDEDA